ncbi:MAG: sigma-54-dependent Fis family transcriptional regulator, partial [Myxococcales bacterium]|nr:sigma-54-dependent Fis family transcriptional regulator [Myxococcales bacterium]
RFDAILLDLGLPDGHGLGAIPTIRTQFPEIALIVITGSYDVPLAVDAMRKGADDFLTKPINLPDLEIFLHKNLELGDFRRRHAVRQRLEPKNVPFFGESDGSKRAMELATLATENDAPVLLQGETGSGKGVLARWVHEHSIRCNAPFVEVNCSSLRGEMLASELFGHAKGAFTSASHERRGLLDVADGGTLFLDEIGDMDLGVQAQFLKVIEEKNYRRLGDVRIRKSDFRLICATHRDLANASEDGPTPFRRDLFFRIHVFPIFLPPLRERQAEFSRLVGVLLDQLGRPHVEVTPEALDLFLRYPWPGNVRELRNVLERALLLSRSNILGASHFPGLGALEPAPTPLPSSRPEPAVMRPAVREVTPATQSPPAFDLRALESEHILRVWDSHQGDAQKAAESLGISRATFYRKLKKAKEKS